MRILLCQDAGLGDTVGFTPVIAHLRKHHPDWYIGTCHKKGQHSVFHGLADAVHTSDRLIGIGMEYDDLVFTHWPENYHPDYDELLGSKASLYLRDEFGIRQEWDLLTYRIDILPEEQERIDKYVATLPSRFVAFHYHGNSGNSNKDITTHAVKTMCEGVIQAGLTPVILDWHGRSPLPDNKTIFCPPIPEDAQAVAALLNRALLCIAIDSGPQKIAFAVGTPTIAIWTRLHPLSYADNTPNAWHLLPEDHERYIRGDKVRGLRFLEDHYNYSTYRGSIADDQQAMKKIVLHKLCAI